MQKFFLLFLFTIALYGDITDFKTLKAAFIQQIVNDQNQSITYKGTLYVKQPNLILWHYSSPIEKSIYISRHNVTVYEPELYQAIIFDQRKELDPVQIFKESKEVSKTKRLSVFNDREITIIHNADKVEKILFRDKVDNTVTIEFETYEKNIELNESLFIFKPEEGTDIIRQ